MIYTELLSIEKTRILHLNQIKIKKLRKEKKRKEKSNDNTLKKKRRLVQKYFP